MAEQEERTEQASTTSEPQESQSTQASQSPQTRETPIEQVRQLKIRIEQLEKELAQEREKATDYMNKAMRAQAEVSNTRKRMQQELSLAMRDMIKSVVYEQLAVLDSFDRAFSSLPGEFRHFSWVDGVSLIQTQLYSVLHRAGVTPIEPSKGKSYNPAEHEAVAYEETTAYPEETVTAELQRGYKLNDQVLRPTLVKIARTPQQVTSGSASEPDKATETHTHS
jgi:molecular chaperone GrpE